MDIAVIQVWSFQTMVAVVNAITGSFGSMKSWWKHYMHYLFPPKSCILSVQEYVLESMDLVRIDFLCPHCFVFNKDAKKYIYFREWPYDLEECKKYLSSPLSFPCMCSSRKNPIISPEFVDPVIEDAYGHELTLELMNACAGPDGIFLKTKTFSSRYLACIIPGLGALSPEESSICIINSDFDTIII